jgi:hypothetical protein
MSVEVLPAADAESRSDLRAFAHNLGYPDSLVAEDFPVWLPTGTVRADLVAFGESPRDMTSATLLGESRGNGDRARERAFAMARTLVVPAAAFTTRKDVELWWLASEDKPPQRIATIPRDDTEQARALGRSLGPDALLRAKRGAVQGALFPVEIQWLEKTRSVAVERLADVVASLTERSHHRLSSSGVQPTETQLSRLVLGTLTIAFVKDRFELQPGSTDWNAYLSATHPRLFSWMRRLKKTEQSVLAEGLAELAESVNMSGLDPALMSTVYENTLLSEQERTDLGVVYTPPDLAKRILTNLPVEEVAPENRRVLDPTCGSGTLLLAAHDRLKGLVSLDVDPAVRHEWLVGHLRGWDQDPFAVEVARLCLTLNAVPNGNGWLVEQADALSKRLPRRQQPTIIVANPPWKSVRSNADKNRDDTAVTFLTWMIHALAPGGLIGVVLPLGWLTAEHSAASRRLVRDACEVLEVWRLPERTFARAEAAPAVLLARKTRAGSRKFHVERRVLHRESLTRLYVQGVADETALVQTTSTPGERKDREASFTARPLTGRIAALPWQTFVADVARVRSGPPRHKGSSMGRGEQLLARNLSTRPYFSEVRRDDCVRIRFPQDFDSRAGGSLQDYSRPKVLVTGKMRPDNPWQSRARIDRIGVIPTDGYIMALPIEDALPSGIKPDRVLFALLALFGSAFASAWVDERRTTRNIPPQLLRDLPLPEGWLSLAPLGEDLSRGATAQEPLSALTSALDEKVFDLFHLSSVEREAFHAHFALHAAPEGGVRFSSPSRQANSPSIEAIDTYGCVLRVDATGVALWAAGLTPDEGISLPLPSRLPGALLAEGIDFRVRADEGGLLDGEFLFHASAYRSPLLIGSDQIGDTGLFEVVEELPNEGDGFISEALQPMSASPRVSSDGSQSLGDESESPQ